MHEYKGWGERNEIVAQTKLECLEDIHNPAPGSRKFNRILSSQDDVSIQGRTPDSGG